MKLSCFNRFSPLASGLALAAFAALFTAGCGNIFIAKHRVLVDAISAPGVTKPAGKSYRLLAKPAALSGGPNQVATTKACVDAALTTQGMFEAPANVAPDIFIEVAYGRDSAPRAEAAVRETFLQLSARENTNAALNRASGPELWDVKVAVLGITGSVENAMPLLAAVAAEHLASNTRAETRIDVPQNSPMVESVRAAAIKSLESKGQPVAPRTAAVVTPTPQVVSPAAPATPAPQTPATSAPRSTPPPAATP